MPSVVNASKIKASLSKRNRVLGMLMMQALYRALQEERSALVLLQAYPDKPIKHITREMFEKEGPFYTFVPNARTDEAIHIVEQWLRQAIRRGEAWIEDQQSGRVQLLSGTTDLDAIVHLARTELERYAQLDAQPASAARQAAMGVQQVLSFPGGRRWVRLVTKASFQREGKLMQHCIHRPDYYRASACGNAAYYSLRDEHGMPKVTIAVINGAVTEARAFSNSDPWDDWCAELFAIIHVMDWQDLSARVGRQPRQPDRPPRFLVHEGDLVFEGNRDPRALPRALRVTGNLLIVDCEWLQMLPEILEVHGDCRIVGCGNLRTMPARLLVRGSASFAGCARLARAAQRIDVRGTLDLTGCRVLPSLPVSMRVDGNLDVTECAHLRPIPAGAVVCGSIRHGQFVARSIADLNRYIEAVAMVSFRRGQGGIWNPPLNTRRL